MPLAVVPAALGAALWTVVTVAAMAAVAALALRATGRQAPWWSVAVLAAGSLALEPVWQTMTFGQVNAVLMLAVLVDMLRPERRWAGVLVGLAAGVKLTPLGFVVLLLLVRRPKAAGRALLTFIVTVAVGLLTVPGAAAYWTERVLDPRRVGPPQFAGNQSLLGVLARWGDAVPSTSVWLAVAGPVGAATLAVAAVVWRRRDRLLGTCLGGVATLLASPMSWSHHWVWAAPLGLAVWDRGRVLAVAWVAVFVARPIWWPPSAESREYGWGALDHLAGDAYVVAALLLAGWLAVALVRGGPASGSPRQRGPVAAGREGVGDGGPVELAPGHRRLPRLPRGPARRGGRLVPDAERVLRRKLTRRG